MEKACGGISAKRLLPELSATGYDGSARKLTGLVAKAKRDWRAGNHRPRRPGVWAPADVLVTDWGAEEGLHVFCAVLAWSHWHFVRFATDETTSTTSEVLVTCSETLVAGVGTTMPVTMAPFLLGLRPGTAQIS